MDETGFWHPYNGAVSITFDDGKVNQLENAVPLLNEFDLKATFYIHPKSDDWFERLRPWTDVAAVGHEIGNHSLSHFCYSNHNPRLGRSENLSLQQVEEDILTAQSRLERIAPDQEHWTFAYPCYELALVKEVSGDLTHL